MHKTALILLAALSTAVANSQNSVALGNLAVVINAKGVRSSDAHPLRAPTGDLWCQASKDGEIQVLEWGRFIRVSDRKVHEAEIEEDGKRARLVLGNAAVTDAGKYRCEVRTADGELIFGNMFAYTKPTVHTNGSLSLTGDDQDENLVRASGSTATRGENFVVDCPVVSYPPASMLWYKDDVPLEQSDRLLMKKTTLEIIDVEDTDGGVYKCVATNQYPIYVDGPEQEFEVKLEQAIKVSGNYGWIYPLIVILIILLLLFIIIYACAAYKRYQRDQYHVARREQRLRGDSEKLTSGPSAV